MEHACSTAAGNTLLINKREPQTNKEVLWPSKCRPLYVVLLSFVSDSCLFSRSVIYLRKSTFGAPHPLYYGIIETSQNGVVHTNIRVLYKIHRTILYIDSSGEQREPRKQKWVKRSCLMAYWDKKKDQLTSEISGIRYTVRAGTTYLSIYFMPSGTAHSTVGRRTVRTNHCSTVLTTHWSCVDERKKRSPNYLSAIPKMVGWVQSHHHLLLL